MEKKCPLKLPPIEIVESRADVKPIRLEGDPFFYFAYRIGDEFLWCDYDYPAKTLSNYSICKVGGPIVVKGKQTLELHCIEYTQEGNRSGESFYYAEVSEQGERGLLWIRKNKDGTGVVEDIDEEIIKRELCVGETFTMQEIYSTGEIQRTCTSKGKIEGHFILRIGEREYQTVRITKWSSEDLAEVYIDIKSGLTVLFRRYNAPSHRVYKELPITREIEDTIYRLWYDSLPIR